ncbi:MAG: PDZ domain-containing protein [Planctomycetia bacterium]|nr:PDZ domain-containing protein [Planctomycetia bacterium]
MNRLAFALLVLPLVLPSVAIAEDPLPACFAQEPEEVRRALVEFKATGSEGACKVLAGAGLKAMDLHAFLAAPRTYREGKAGLVTKSVELGKDLTLEVAIRVPEGYDPAKPHPVLVNMHGGVSRAEPIPVDQLGEGMAGMLSMLDEADLKPIEILPQGCAKCLWWTETGMAMVLGSVRLAATDCNVDMDRVFVTGFSDGGSGSWFYGAVNPTPFAGMIPLNGSPLVAEMGGFEIHLANYRNRPVFACSNADDPLYPASIVQPVMDRIRALKAPLEFTMYETGGHSLTYVDPMTEPFLKWWNATRRDAWRDRVEWTRGEKGGARCDWLEIAEIGDTGSKTAWEPATVKIRAPKRLGVTLAQDFEGPGAKVDRVEPESSAAKLGVQKDDILVEANGKEIEGFQDVRSFVQGVNPGDEVTLVVKRGEERVELKGKMQAATDREAFTYEAKPGWVSASRKGNAFELRTFRARRVVLSLNPAQVDLAKPVTVTADGKVVFEGTVEPSAAAILETYRADFDPRALPAARVEVRLP